MKKHTRGGNTVVDYKDCFTKDEWHELMAAKEVANNSAVELRVSSPLFGKETTYSLFLNDISLIGQGFTLSDANWPHAKRILQQHFNLKE